MIANSDNGVEVVEVSTIDFLSLAVISILEITGSSDCSCSVKKFLVFVDG